MGEIGLGSFWCRWKAYTKFPNTCSLKIFRYHECFSHKLAENRGKYFLSGGSLWRYISRLWSRDIPKLFTPKLKKFTCQTSLEQKLCDQRCGYSTLFWFAWHSYKYIRTLLWHYCAYLWKIGEHANIYWRLFVQKIIIIYFPIPTFLGPLSAFTFIVSL